MKELYEDINFLLDTTHLLCQEIADKLKCDVTIVEYIVENRFKKVMGL